MSSPLGDPLRALARIAQIDALLGERPRQPPTGGRAGTIVEARVVGRAPDGVYVVEMATGRLRVPLPDTHPPGSVLRLRLVDGAAPEVIQPTQDTAELSGPATLIGRVLARAADTPAAPLRPVMPLDVAASGPAAVARELQSSVELSGLFYESHLAQWNEGRRELDALRAEPQARFGATGQPTPDSEASGAADANDARPGGDAKPATALRAPPDPPPAAEAKSAVAPAGEPSAPPAPPRGDVPAPLLPLLQQQLEVLDSRTVLWQGTVWPGQEARLEIAEEQRGRGVHAPESAGWSTKLVVDLPALGRVEARVAVHPGAGVTVDVRAASAVAHALSAQGSAFAAALAADGIRLERFAVYPDE